MQQNVIKISDILNHRYDPYYYSEEFIKLKKQLQHVSSVCVGDIIESWNRGDGPREGYYTENKEIGVPFIRINNLSNHSVTLKDVKYINREIHNTKLKRTQISPNDIIFAISGTKDNLGTVSIVPDTIKEANLNSALVKLKLFQDKIIPMYFCYLFDLDLVRKQIDYIGKGAAQNNLNNNEISEIIIPLPNKERQRYVIEIMNNANNIKYQKLKNADNLLLSIDSFIFNTLELKIPILNKEKEYVTKISNILGSRFDPDYNQVCFTDVYSCLTKNNYDLLKNLLIYYKKGTEVGTSQYTEQGVPFIRVSDFNSYGFTYSSNTKFISLDYFNELKEFSPRIGDILFSKDGTIGNSFLINEDINGIISGGIIRLHPNENRINSQYLSVMLSLNIYKQFFERNSIGAIIKHLNIEELLNLPIPLPDRKVQDKIAGYTLEIIEAAKKMKEEANKELELAKQKVEKILLGE